MFDFEELDEVTRGYILQEFQAEEDSGKPYRSTRLNPLGREIFPQLMRNAIENGNEISLAKALSLPKYWHSNHNGQVQALAITEFNTWYVRGLSRRLLEEGEEHCEVYRAAPAKYSIRSECSLHEGQIYLVQRIYDGHRCRYRTDSPDKTALSIPTGTNCHHTIRRVKLIESH